MKIFINPGHDVELDSGAVNPASGLREADVVLAVGKLLNDYLQTAGCETYLLQNDDLNQVCAIANSWPTDLFVSLHCNAFNCLARGTETLIYSMGSESEVLARCVQNGLYDTLSKIDQSLPDRGLKERPGLAVLKYTNMPAILVEIAFIDNADDVILLENYQDTIARAIARGITDYQKAK
jgi:N-acetylmuramoyl-L-alanine amidase